MAIRIFRVIRDIKNWMFIKKTIKEYRDKPEWKLHNLTHDWFYRIGCVINMRKEDFGESDEIHMVRFMDFAKPALQYVGEKMGLGEILLPEHYRIGEDYAYLMLFHQKMTGLSMWYVFSRLVAIIGLVILSCYIF